MNCTRQTLQVIRKLFKGRQDYLIAEIKCIKFINGVRYTGKDKAPRYKEIKEDIKIVKEEMEDIYMFDEDALMPLEWAADAAAERASCPEEVRGRVSQAFCIAHKEEIAERLQINIIEARITEENAREDAKSLYNMRYYIATAKPVNAYSRAFNRKMVAFMKGLDMSKGFRADGSQDF